MLAHSGCIEKMMGLGRWGNRAPDESKIRYKTNDAITKSREKTRMTSHKQSKDWKSSWSQDSWHHDSLSDFDSEESDPLESEVLSDSQELDEDALRRFAPSRKGPI